MTDRNNYGHCFRKLRVQLYSVSVIRVDHQRLERGFWGRIERNGTVLFTWAVLWTL